MGKSHQHNVLGEVGLTVTEVQPSSEGRWAFTELYEEPWPSWAFIYLHHPAHMRLKECKPARPLPSIAVRKIWYFLTDT